VCSSDQPLIISFFSPYSPASLVTPLDSTLQSTIRSLIPPSLVTMVSFFSYAPLALLALSDVSGALVPTHNRLMKRALTARSVMPPTYAQGYLENYNDYHIRYLALDCENQHGKPFFDQCCHPMLATENLDTARPKQCRPSAAALSSATLAEPTSTVKTPVDNEDDVDCDNEDPQPTATGTPSGHQAPKQDPPQQDIAQQAPPKNNGSSAAVSSGGGSGVHTGGQGTFFYQNGVAGACGTVHSDNDFIAALDSRTYGNTGVKSPYCGKKITITNTGNGRTVQVTVADACPTCENPASVDLSVAAFGHLADLSEGDINIQWTEE
jgi:hypothetical protein